MNKVSFKIINQKRLILVPKYRFSNTILNLHYTLISCERDFQEVFEYNKGFLPDINKCMELKLLEENLIHKILCKKRPLEESLINFISLEGTTMDSEYGGNKRPVSKKMPVRLKIP